MSDSNEGLKGPNCFDSSNNHVIYYSSLAGGLITTFLKYVFQVWVDRVSYLGQAKSEILLNSVGYWILIR